MTTWWDVLIFVAGMIISGAISFGGVPGIIEKIKQFIPVTDAWAYLLSQVINALLSFLTLLGAGYILPDSFTPENLPALVLAVLIGAQAGFASKKRKQQA